MSTGLDIDKDTKKAERILDLFEMGKLDEAEDLNDVQILIFLRILKKYLGRSSTITEILKAKSNISIQHLGDYEKVKNLESELTKQIHARVAANSRTSG